MKDALALTAFLGFSLGIVCQSFAALPLPVIAFILLLAAGFFIAWFFGRRDAYLVQALFLLLLAVGCGRMLLAPPTLPVSFREQLDAPVSLTGTVIHDPDMRETNQRVVVRVKSGNEQTSILAVAERFPIFSVGDEVTVTGTLELPQAFETDGGRTFDYRMFLAKDGIMTFVPHAHIEKTGMTSNLGLRTLRILFDAKHAFVRALEAALPEPHASLAEGLITGGKQGLGSALLNAFTVVGLLPIIVLSGYNVMIVADAVLVTFAFLPRRFSLVIATVIIGLFVLIAGAGASAVRAGLMAGIGLFARATRRTYDALRALLLTFVLMLTLNPLLLVHDPGFQFSFVATLGLILAAPSLEVAFKRIPVPMFREIVATSIAAQLFVLPLLLYQTGNLSLVALPANILVLPVVPLAMALSALAGGVALVVPFLAVYAGLPAYVLLGYIVLIAENLARIPFANVIVPAFPAIVVALLYGGVAWFVFHIRKKAPVGSAVSLTPVRVK